MLARPTIAETIMPTTKFTLIMAGLAITSGIFTSAAPKMIGVYIKKEKRAALYLVKPSNNPTVIVIPERDTPGIIASAWETPIHMAVEKVIWSISLFLRLF